MKHLTILVDMDDTIESLASAWVDYLNARHGTTTKLTDITGWDTPKTVSVSLTQDSGTAMRRL